MIFHIGQRVRVARPSRNPLSQKYVGMEGVIVGHGRRKAWYYEGRLWDWRVEFAIPVHAPTNLPPNIINVMSEQLEPILDQDNSSESEAAKKFLDGIRKLQPLPEKEIA